MLYKEKLMQSLKVEQNAINKMYLNELLINWKKVESAVEESNGSPISAMITAISAYTKNLSVAKFKYNSSKKCGFSENHDVFQGHYLFDIVETILSVVGIKESKQGLYIKNKAFHTGIRLNKESFNKIISKPKFELFTSGKYLNVGIELDFNFKLIGKTHYTKSKLSIPLIVFYIDKYYTEKSFEEIKQLQKDVVAINPNALLICLTESVDRKLINNYEDIYKHLYILRTNFKEDGYNDLQPQVALSLYNKLYNFAFNAIPNIEKIVSFGHIDLVQKEQKEEEMILSSSLKSIEEDHDNEESEV